MAGDPLADLKKIIEQAGFNMKLTTAVVHYANDKTSELRTHLSKLNEEELGAAHLVFATLARETADVLDKRNVKKLPAEWQSDRSIDRMVVLPLGWTHPGGTYEPRPWCEAVSRKEFLDRMGMSGSMLKEHGTKDFAYTEVEK